MKNQAIILAAAIFASAVVLGLFTFLSVNSYNSVMTKKVQSEAVDNCFKSAQIESKRYIEEENKDLIIKEPVREIYTYCLRDKGLEVTEL